MPHPADAAVRDGVDRDHRRQVGRVHLGQGVLGAAGITGAERADLAVGPLLPGDPLDDLEAVLGIVDDQPPGPLAGVTAPDVVGDHDVAPLGIVAALAAGAVLVVGRAGQERRKPPGSRLAVARRPIDVGGQMNAVSHRDPHVLLDDHAKLRRPHTHPRRLAAGRPAARPQERNQPSHHEREKNLQAFVAAWSLTSASSVPSHRRSFRTALSRLSSADRGKQQPSGTASARPRKIRKPPGRFSLTRRPVDRYDSADVQPDDLLMRGIHAQSSKRQFAF